VVEYALRMGLATGCEINKVSSHDRKNYFYADLPRGYQITQSETPVCQNGRVEFIHKGEKQTVRLTRIHIEEDTAKLLHDENFKGTLIDYNRCGVPLIEIVSEPDLRSAEEVKDYLEAVRLLLVTLGISSGRMQEGVMRCDINVSVRPEGQAEYGTRVEMKNVSTFSGAVLAVNYESARQIRRLEAGEAVVQETRRWDESLGESLPMRVKEGAADYRYFPESDLQPLVIGDDWIERVRAALPELPVARFERYRALGIPEFESRILTENPDKAAFFEQCRPTARCANWVVGELTARLGKAMLPISQSPCSPGNLDAILDMTEKGVISNDAAKRVLDELFVSGGDPEEIVGKLQLAQVSDEDDLKQIVEDVLNANARSVTDYQNGKTNALGFLTGLCMKQTKGKGNPQIINRLLREALEK
jgi:aspartyl-tRNA(Asn)/glutamyl-tRNA(Gln) amidotransferase subunit B